MDGELTLIENSFTKLKTLEGRFLENERAYRSIYKKGADGESGRTSRTKASERKRSKLYIPLTQTTVDIMFALFKTSFMSNRCPIEIERVGLNTEHDRKVQNVLMAAVKDAWKNPSHRVGLSKGVLSAIMQPMGL